MKLKITFVLLAVLAAVAIGGVGCRHDLSAQKPSTKDRKPIYYTCPMHPSVKVAALANCPICGMKLVPAYEETDNGPIAPCGAACCVVPGATNKP